MIERNITLDYFKILLATLVITIHMQPLFTQGSLLGWLISNGISRIAVPCFFIINGYFIFSKITDKKAIFKYLKRLLIIYIVWALIYLPFTFGGSIPKTLLNLFVGYYHLWYVPALIIGVALLFILKKFIRNNYVLLFIAIALYFIGSIIQYSFVSTSMAELLLYRNALFDAFPYIFIGFFIHSIKDKLSDSNFSMVYVLFAVTLCTLFFESYLAYHNLTERDMFASSILFCPALVMIILRHSKYTQNDGYIGLLSSGIYFSHLLVIMLVKRIFGFGGFNYIYALPLVLLLSGVISAGIIEINKRIKIFL